MAGVRRFLLRLITAIRAGRAEDDLAREMRAHLALLEDDCRAQGMDAESARLAARRAFGGVEQVKELQRDARSFRWISDLRQDVRYGARSFARSPGFTAAAIVTLALGIGAATTIFGALYAIGIKPLAYADPDRIVRVFEYLPPREAGGAPRRGNPFAPSQLDAVRQATTLSHVALEIPRLMIMRAGETAARVGGSRVSAAMFPLIDARPILGRGLQQEDEHKGSDNVVVISHSLWQQQLGGRDDVIGAALTLDDRPHTIVGVMPAGFQFPPGSTGEMWTPLVPAGTPPTFRLPFYARLRDGVSLTAAQEEIATIYDAVRSTNPSNRPRLEMVPAKDVVIEPIKPAMTMLAVAVILVLLIACVNVANLVLARSIVRRYEMSLRSALGASRMRLLRQHLTEGVLLAALSFAGSMLITTVSMSWMQSLTNASPRRDMLPGLSIPRAAEIHVDATVIAFAIGISLLAGLAFGLIAGARHPASLTPGLRRDGRPWPLPGARGIQHALVIAEVAMAVVLFIGSALMIRSFVHLATIDTGFTTRERMTFQVTLPPTRTVPEVTRFGEELVERIGAMPSVRAAAYAESLPMVPVGRLAALSTTPSFPKPDPGAPPRLDVRIVSHTYLEVMGIRIVEGRSLQESDGAGTAMLSSLRSVVAQMDSLAFIDNVAPLEHLVSNSYARPRAYALLLGAYAAVAIGLVAVGIYGVIAFGVVQRTREIGIRMALGAQRRQVRALVLRDSALVTAIGLVIGIGGAVWSSRLFEGLLFGITPLDRTTYAVVAAAFAAIAIVAAFIPARRASAVDPVTALRAE